MPQHVFESTHAPTGAPTHIGQHWVDTVLEEIYFSVGTADVGDWVKVFPIPTPSYFRIHNGYIQIYNHMTTRYHSLMVTGLIGEEQLVIGEGEL